MTVHLIRHGQTKENAQKRYCGRTDPPLSREGVASLKALKAQGVYPQADAFYSSGMLRARQTLSILYGDVVSVTIPDLAEYDFGAFEEKRYDELRHDPAYVAWISDTEGFVACPGGESRRQYHRRVLRGFSALLSDIAQKRALSAVVIAHGGTIVHIMSHLFPNEKDFYAWQPRPGHGYTLRLEAAAAPGGVAHWSPISCE